MLCLKVACGGHDLTDPITQKCYTTISGSNEIFLQLKMPTKAGSLGNGSVESKKEHTCNSKNTKATHILEMRDLI
ncbi:hypothetical protein ACOSP7_008491 [Xanthoceras sorbifolium]